MRDPQAFKGLAGAVRADIERLLATLPADSPLRQRLTRSLLTVQLLDTGVPDRQVQTRLGTLAKELDGNDLSALLLKSYVSTLQAQGWPAKLDEPARSEFRRQLQSSLERDEPNRRLGQVQGLLAKLPQWDRQVLSGIAHSTLQPAIDANHALSGELALQLIELRFIADVLAPVRDDVQATLRDYQKQHAGVANYWAGRAMTPAADRACQPVIVAVWDSGVDTDLFTDQLFVNAQERADGVDNDRNGFVDDVHGIGFDLSGQPTPQLLQTFGPALDRSDALRRMKGMLDAQAALDTPEARDLVTRMRSLPPAQVPAFRQELGLIGNYLHGTWVASIAAQSNPCARLLVVRNEFEYRLPPAPWSNQWADQMASNVQRTVQYLSTNKTRIANLSWRLSRREIELNLESAGTKLSASERAAAAQASFERIRTALLESMRAANDILFVVSAGNSDAEFTDVIPASFELPNVVTVGAVDEYGQRASFSNIGPAVDVHAPGVGIAGLAPGGERVSWSGTSGAAPAVTNLAIKLLALNPQLSPAALRELIVQQAAAEVPDGPAIIHPKRTAERLRAGA